jgi:uncharacterized protein YcfJ|tara:strand:+ start:2845 stop:3387 length:543 start_codon:yes stop_codon:yes gene_type:complete
MNKLAYGIILTTILFAQSVFAESRTDTVINVDGYVVDTQTLTVKTQLVETPIRTCNIVNVPIYGNTGKTQTGEVLGGAIIGGILGNQVGGGKGKDAATILGAILGADFANKKGGQQKIVGYKQVEQCEVTYEKTYQTITRCDVTVSIPAIKGVTHTYVTDTCPANNTKVKLVTSLSIQRR